MSNDSSYQTMICCPYCGFLNTDENAALLDLLRKEVFLLECKRCKKNSTIILYDASQKVIPNDTSPNSVPDKPYRMSEILTEEDVEEFAGAFLRNVNKELGIEDDE